MPANATPGSARNTGRLQQFLHHVFPALNPAGRRDETRLALVHSLALGKDCHLLLVACGEQHYLIGRGRTNVDSIVPILPPPAIPAGRLKPVPATLTLPRGWQIFKGQKNSAGPNA